MTETTKPECTCQRREKWKLVCRCFCPKCHSRNLRWVAWGVYLDKDLICQNCQHEVDDWDC